MRTSDKHSNLLGQFLSYEENEVLWIRTQISFKTFIGEKSQMLKNQQPLKLKKTQAQIWNP